MSDSQLDAGVREALDAGVGFPRFASATASANKAAPPDDGLGDSIDIKYATDLIGAEMFGVPTCPHRF